MDNLNNIAAQLESLKMQVSGLESSLRVNNSFQQASQLVATRSVPVLTTAHQNSVGSAIAAMSLGAVSSIAWPAANQYVFEPVVIPSPMGTFAPSCSHMSGAGNFQTALYDSAGHMLTSASNGVMGAVIYVPAGLYYMALWGSATTLQFAGWNTPTSVPAADIGVDWQGTPATALPSPRPPDSSNTLFTFVPFLSIGLQLWSGA